MNFDWLLALLPILALTCNVLTQNFFSQIRANINFAIVSGFLSGLVANCLGFISLYFNGYSISFIDGIMCLMSYITLSFCFFAFLNLNLTSLRIRIARELRQAKTVGVPLTALSQIYSPHEVFERRLIRLVKAEHIVGADNKWFICSKKLLILVFVSQLLRKMIMRRVRL